jgi:hypothetical protein
MIAGQGAGEGTGARAKDHREDVGTSGSAPGASIGLAGRGAYVHVRASRL